MSGTTIRDWPGTLAFQRILSSLSQSFMNRSEKSTSPLMIAFAWLVVLIPLGWGVIQSVIKSLPLFEMSATQEPRPPAEK